MAAVAPRNGTWIRSTPACILNNSPPRCCGVPTPTEPKVSLFGVFLASAMNSLHRFRRQVRRHHHDERDVGDEIDRREFRDRVVERVARQMRAHRERGRRDQHEIAVGRRLRHIGIGDDAAAAGLVVDHGGLVEVRLQAAGDLAGDHVVGTARRKRHDDMDRSCSETPARSRRSAEQEQAASDDATRRKVEPCVLPIAARGARHWRVMYCLASPCPRGETGDQSGGRQTRERLIMARKMKLGLFIRPCGHHIAAWRHPHARRTPASISRTSSRWRRSPSAGCSTCCSRPTTTPSGRCRNRRSSACITAPGLSPIRCCPRYPATPRTSASSAQPAPASSSLIRWRGSSRRST